LVLCPPSKTSDQKTGSIPANTCLLMLLRIITIMMCFRTIIIAIAVSSNLKAELKVYTDFGNILHLCKRCYEIYDPLHRSSSGFQGSIHHEINILYLNLLVRIFLHIGVNIFSLIRVKTTFSIFSLINCIAWYKYMNICTGTYEYLFHLSV
jgi:hypothetical protein